MAENLKNCPICKSEELKAEIISSNWNYFINCKRCGCFMITDQALEDYNYDFSDDDLNLFSGYLRNNSYRKNPILVKTDMLAQLKEIILPFKRLPIIEKVNRIINYVGNSTGIGQKKTLDLDNDFTEFYCKNKLELISLLRYAKEQNLFIDFLLPQNPIRMHESAKPPSHLVILELSYYGWQRFDENQKINFKSKKAFIAMSFDEDLNDVYLKAVFEGCKECGYNAVRVDKSEHNEKICDRIISEIKQSRFVVAEFTRQKHGVYFEAGYAYGLGLPVIWCCKEEEKDKLHFDTRQYNHIIWKTIEEFKEKLVNRIKATI